MEHLSVHHRRVPHQLLQPRRISSLLFATIIFRPQVSMEPPFPETRCQFITKSPLQPRVLLLLLLGVFVALLLLFQSLRLSSPFFVIDEEASRGRRLLLLLSLRLPLSRRVSRGVPPPPPSSSREDRATRHETEGRSLLPVPRRPPVGEEVDLQGKAAEQEEEEVEKEEEEEEDGATWFDS